MVKFITVMFMLCSIYSSSPEAPGPIPQTLNEFNTLISQGIPSGSDSIQQESKPDSDEILNYLDELKKLGYYRKDSKDEKLNKRNAIIRFQSDHNIAISGEWNDESLSALKKRKSAESFSYPDEITNPPTDAKWITVNKTKRILTLYMGSKVLKKYPVAVGNPPSLTPSGKFTICSKVVNPTWGGGGYAKPVSGGSPENPLGYRWMGLSLNGGDRYGIHGNNRPYSIGKNVSHGCIRMINSDVEQLFEIVARSTEVWIGTDKELTDGGVLQKAYADTDEKK